MKRFLRRKLRDQRVLHSNMQHIQIYIGEGSLCPGRSFPVWTIGKVKGRSVSRCSSWDTERSTSSALAGKVERGYQNKMDLRADSEDWPLAGEELRDRLLYYACTVGAWLLPRILVEETTGRQQLMSLLRGLWHTLFSCARWTKARVQFKMKTPLDFVSKFQQDTEIGDPHGDCQAMVDVIRHIIRT